MLESHGVFLKQWRALTYRETSMLWFALSILFGFALLVWGADRFVIGAAALAHNLGVSSLLIGLTIVGFGTSAPEVLVSLMAALNGNPGLAIGNAIGSNITNIALVLGMTALVVPLTVGSTTLKREYPMLVGVTLLACALMWDGALSVTDGWILLATLVVVLFLLWRIAVSQRQGDPLGSEIDEEIPTDMSSGTALAWFLLGLVVLLVSSRMLVWGAVGIAHAFGVSDLVIGLTIVALGTSLPELAASVGSAIKGEHDIAIGNVIGSNIYNLLGVLSMPALIAPGTLEGAVLQRDIPMMLGLTLALFLIAYGFRGPGRINRFEGALLTAAFIAYQGFLFYSVDPVG